MYKNVLMFLGGALIGSTLTYLFIKDKYEKIAEDEIQSVKDEYSKTYEAKKKISELKEAKSELADKIFASYKQTANEYNHPNEAVRYNIFKNEREIEENAEDDTEEYSDHPTEGIAEEPYTISPDLFDNDKKYFDKITLEYYEGNDMLVEEITNEPVDIDYAIGRESLRMFGEFEKDLVYVRNERISTDYEVYHYSGSFISDQ